MEACQRESLATSDIDSRQTEISADPEMVQIIRIALIRVVSSW